MKKLLLVATFVIVGITGTVSAKSAVEKKTVQNLEMSSENVKQYVTYNINSVRLTDDMLGTCYMTFTAYNAAGEALYSWTEEYWAYSYQNCQDLGAYRLEQLTSGS